MVREFKLPDVGEGLTEAEIVTWLVEEGDTVTEDQPVAEVETDKAVVEVPAPVNGTVREILAEAGEMVPVGEVIITFDVEGEPVEPVDEGGTEPEPDESAVAEADTPTDAGTDGESGGEVSAKGGRVFAAPSARRLARELGVDIETVAGSGPGGRVSEADVRAAAAGDGAADTGAEPEPAAASGDATAAEPVVEAAPATADRDRTAARPSTRGVARDLGVDIDTVPTDAEHKGYALVTTEQVRQFAAAAEHEQAAEAATPTEQPEAAAATGDEERVERIPYRGLRRTIGERMTTAKFTAPHVTAHHHPDVTELVRVREELAAEAEQRGIRLTYMPFVLKATVAALRANPNLNAELDEENGEIIRKRYYHIGVATATEEGLLVPVVEDVDQKGILELAAEVNDLAERARERSLSPEELQGGTFTVSNWGAIAGNYATPILNYPQTGILGLGELKPRPRVVDEGETGTPFADDGSVPGSVVPRYTMPLSVSFDHRVADGLDGGRFASDLIERLEDPYRLLL
ncbi:dihydrolipoamide acetyltransferase family protein [Haloglomus litoreum]|uniref:dihydrolipoamide acetyltransferase family protein n=1 Tax=Haloglomus litoreum TaxID=3034026 RepID=UPI0023E85C32|nr:dihydrolipoamide acetyltransferase family protein [Haloglomus sp. DT116]